MKKKKWGEVFFYFIVMLVMSGIFSSNAAAAMKTSFHGYFESSFYLRDADGIQNGFFDEAYGVQQRNTLKFDIDVSPDISLGSFAVEKVHLTFRGAYDSIFDLAADRYKIQDDLGASRFDYGLEDIRFEQDLREAFIDFTYNGELGSAFFRPGRQIVSWGEGFLETLNDVINPPDQSFQMFFQNPDDLKIPLRMGRLNYNMPRMIRGLNLNFDLLWIPDIRPTQFSVRDTTPLDRTAGLQAPYSFLLNEFLGQGLYLREDVPTNENEYGAKVTAEIGRRLSLSVLYFRDVNNDPGVVIKPLKRTALFTHNKQHVYGGYFSYQVVPPVDIIVRGEVSRHTAEPISLASPVFDNSWRFTPAPTPTSTDSGLNTFVYKPVTKFMLAIDKDVRWKWVSPHDLTKISFEWLRRYINEWESDETIEDLMGAAKYNSLTGERVKDHRNVRVSDTLISRDTVLWPQEIESILIG